MNKVLGVLAALLLAAVGLYAQDAQTAQAPAQAPTAQDPTAQTPTAQTPTAQAPAQTPADSSSTTATAGQDQGSSSDNLDNLFNGTTDTANGANGSTTTGTGTTGTDTTPQPRPDDLTRDNRIHFLSDLAIYGLAGVGWKNVYTPSDLTGPLSGEVSGSLSANLSIDFRPAPQLRFRGTLSYNFPFPILPTQMSQLIVDYTVMDAVFFTVGIFDYGWGSSQFFQYANLPYRALPSFIGVLNVPLFQKQYLLTSNVVTNYPASVRMYIPFGVDGLTFLARFDTANYGFPIATAPDPRYAGFGMLFDLVTGPIQWTLGGYTQERLAPRTLLAMKTSILGFDLSVETTQAYSVNIITDGVTRPITDPLQPIPVSGGGIWTGNPTLQAIYPTLVVGLFKEWQDPHIRLYAEYGYNGERDGATHTSWLSDNNGPGGHNTVLALRFSSLLGSAFTLNAMWQQSWSDGSGLLSALLEFSPFALTTIQVGPRFAYGPADGETFMNTLVPGGKRLELVMLVKVSDSFRQ